MTCHAETQVDLPLEPQAAWDAVMDWNGQSAWMLFTRVWTTGNNGEGLGGGVAARTSVGPVGFTDEMVITHWDPPRECTVKHLGTVVRGTGTFVVRPAPGGRSTFVWSEDVIPPLGRLGRTAWPLVRPAFELMMRISLNRLAKVVAR